MATAFVALDGVLRTEVGDPIAEGVKLYRILAENYRVIITSDHSPELTEHWLRTNLIVGYGDIYDNRYFFEGQDLRARQLAIAQAQGIVDLFVDPDADRCAFALSRGVPTILFAAPKFIRRSRDVRPWQDLADEVERQRQALMDAHLGSNVKRFE
jgi:hypothetical protein